MRLLINTASTHKGGGVQVARSFIEECRNYCENEYYVVMGTMLSNLINPDDYPEYFSFYKIGYRPATRVLGFKSPERDLRKLEGSIKPDVVFTTSGPAYWRPNAPHLVGYNLPHYIYRDSPFFSLIPFSRRLKWYLKGEVLKYFFKRDSKAFVVQTDDVNWRLRDWLKTENVYTVSNTHSQHYNCPKVVGNKLPEKAIDEFRFLTISAWHTHKNLKIIPKVIDALPQEIRNRVRFILTLPDETYQKNFSGELGDNIINVGPVKPEEGPALYQECDALFLPTLLECFSASYAEAMKMEKPIITSDLSFAHTICGEAALYAEPLNSNAFSEKIIALIESQQLQDQLIKAGANQLNEFVTAKERAERYLTICKELAYERAKTQ